MPQPSDHALYAPSASHRWLHCPGSVTHTDDETNDAATWGTEVHEWLSDGEGSDFSMPEHWTSEQQADAIKCKRVWLSTVPDQALRETLLVHPRFRNVFFGTADALWVDNSEETGEQICRVADLKTGLRLVGAIDNPQVACYLLLASYRYPEIDTFWGTIVQPRRFVEETWKLTRAELEEFEAKVLRSIGGHTLAAGHHCEFCPAKASCAELHKALFRIRLSLSDLQDIVIGHDYT